MTPLRQIREVAPSELREHSLTHLVPLMRADEWDNFYRDVAFAGIRVPIEVLADGTVMDGRHRLRAALQLGLATVPIIDAPLNGDSPDVYMIKAAVMRRHLTDDQRSQLAFYWKQEHKEQGRRTDLAETTSPPRGGEVSHIGPTGQAATELFKVSRRGLDNATYVGLRAPELAQKVLAGDMSLSTAKRQVGKAERPGRKELPSGVFDVIYADPPWPYQNVIDKWGPSALHYPSMSIDDLRAMKPPAADNAVLFLWVTNPFLREGLALATAWGFTYKTNIVWVKRNMTRRGVGFYVRGRHELLFICIRGSYVPDMQGKEPVGSVIDADFTEHSKKPSEAYAVIEALYPNSRYLELFARGEARDGWTTWGNEKSE